MKYTLSGSGSAMNILLIIPTCGAAIPTPHSNLIVSSMSSKVIFILSFISATSLHFFLKISSPSVTIFLIATILLLLIYTIWVYVNGNCTIDALFQYLSAKRIYIKYVFIAKTLWTLN